MPLVIHIAADPKITEQGYKFVFRNFPNAPMLMTGALSLLKDLFEATGTTPQTAVLMSVNDTFGQAAQNAINALLPKLGMPFRLVDTITYDPQAKDLSVEVAKGEIVCVAGANGAGKSTLLKSIAGAERPRSGSVSFDGTRIDGMAQHVRGHRGVRGGGGLRGSRSVCNSLRRPASECCRGVCPTR